MASLNQLKSRNTRKTFKQLPSLMLIPDSDWGETIYPNGKRHYTTPDGNCYPSVTTFIDSISDKDFLIKWREKKGEDEANRIVERSCERGELIHKCLEHYVLNQQVDPKMCGEFEFMFHQIRRVIDARLDGVLYSEHALWSDVLKLAGRVDLCGLWNGELSIIDFKGKSRIMKRDDIENYFIQCTIYAIMHHERYGVLPKQIVVLMSVEDHSVMNCQVMIEQTKDWIPKVLELVRQSRSGK